MPDDDVHVVGDAEVLRRAGARRAEDADRVRVVHRQRRAEPVRQLREVRQVGDVAFHRVDAVHDDHRAPGTVLAPEQPLQPREVAVVEPHHVAERQLRAVHDGRVIELVEVDDVAAPHQAGDQPEVRLVAGREHQGGFLARELGQPRPRAVSCRSSVPFRNRLPVQPEPYRSSAFRAASSTFG